MGCQVKTLQQMPPVSQANQHLKHASQRLISYKEVLLHMAELPAAHAGCTHYLPPGTRSCSGCARCMVQPLHANTCVLQPQLSCILMLQGAWRLLRW